MCNEKKARELRGALGMEKKGIVRSDFKRKNKEEMDFFQKMYCEID